MQDWFNLGFASFCIDSSAKPMERGTLLIFWPLHCNIYDGTCKNSRILWSILHLRWIRFGKEVAQLYSND